MSYRAFPFVLTALMAAVLLIDGAMVLALMAAHKPFRTYAAVVPGTLVAVLIPYAVSSAAWRRRGHAP